MKNVKIKISYFLLLFINFIFTYKYTLRHTEFAIYISIALFAFQVSFIKYNHLINISKKWLKFYFTLLIIALVGLVLLSYLNIPLDSLNSDRGSLISSFWKVFFKGEYPYHAKSHLNSLPGPMPIYFIIALPFNFIGELGLLSILGYVIFIIFSIKIKLPINNLKFILFFFSSSVYILWEIATRSNVFTNSLLILLIINSFLSLKKEGGKIPFYCLAILTGLLLSTRSIFILVYVVFFLSSLLNKEIDFKSLLKYLFIAFLAFVFTFLPLLIFFYKDFLIVNPFLIQSSFLIPLPYTISFIISSFLFAFFVKNKPDKFFYSGLVLFFSIMIYSIYHILKHGFFQAYHNSEIDISYFIFCIPFLLYYITLIKKEPSLKPHSII